ncbi:MAG: ABC transporter substrate-binding protein [Flavonifractor plautii]
MGLVTSGGFNVLGNDGRCSLIGREAGFANVGADAQPGTSTHGNEASFEFLVDKDPDYLFVLDRDAAIGTDGAKLAQEVVENELMKGTAAYRDGRSSTWPIPPCGTRRGRHHRAGPDAPGS